jgi:hypothetical protein
MITNLFDDLLERRFTHFVGGAWRAPLGTQSVPVTGALGQVVCAGPADLARAQLLRRPSPGAGQVLARALAQSAPMIAQQMQAHKAAIDAATLTSIARGLQHPQPVPCSIVTTCAKASPEGLGRALACGFAAGVIHTPATQDALLGIILSRLSQAAGLPPGSYAMLYA